jgi:prepilin peptidase CpaA
MSDRFCVESSAGAVVRGRRNAAQFLLEVLPFTMSLHPQAIVVTAFGVVMAAAVVEDFRRLVIPNLLPIMLVALWPVYFAAVAPSWSGALAAIACALAVFIVGAFLFARGYLGGGDVKLLSAAALWAGPAGTPGLLLLTGILGGALALFLLMPLGAEIASMARTALSRRSMPIETAMPNAVPYGVAIAAAAVITILSPSIS